MDRLTYRSGDNIYLKGGLDGKWQSAGGYDIIKKATEKLAMYEDQEETCSLSSDQVKYIMAEADHLRVAVTKFESLMDKLRVGVMGEGYFADDEVLIDDIIHKYGKKRKSIFARFGKKDDVSEG